MIKAEIDLNSLLALLKRRLKLCSIKLYCKFVSLRLNLGLEANEFDWCFYF